VLEGDLYDVSRRAVPGVNPSQKDDSISDRICSMEKTTRLDAQSGVGWSSRN
jgi:hypothetical protein